VLAQRDVDAFQISRFDHVVGIEEHESGAASRRNGCVSCRRRSNAVGRIDGRGCQPSRIAPRYITGTVARSVVKDNHFPCEGRLLVRQCVELLRQQGHGIPTGNDDR
jgi:hypothetical protein